MSLKLLTSGFRTWLRSQYRGWTYSPRHGGGGTADQHQHIGTHRVIKTETPYKTPGRATNHGNWGDEDTGLWPIVTPREIGFVA